MPTEKQTISQLMAGHMRLYSSGIRSVIHLNISLNKKFGPSFHTGFALSNGANALCRILEIPVLEGASGWMKFNCTVIASLDLSYH